jgi:hypothetical protein
MGCDLCCDKTGTSCGNANVGLVCAWTRMLLEQLERSGSPIGQAIKQCSATHYEMLGMDEMLEPFIGRPEAFYQFLGEKWNWIVTVDEGGKKLIADENKSACVCPLVRANAASSSVLCNCSEGFAEKMFSYVMQKPVQARVVESILRGGERCVYEISWQ